MIVFSHGQFVRALLWTLLTGRQGTPPDQAAMRRFRAFDTAVPVPNGAILPLRVAGGGVYAGALRTEHLGRNGGSGQ